MSPFTAFDYQRVTITFTLADATQCVMDFEPEDMAMADANNLAKQIRAVERLTGKRVTEVALHAVTNRKAGE